MRSPPPDGQGHARGQTARLAELVELLRHDAGVAADLVLPPLLVVDLLDDGHGDDDLVVLEGEEGAGVVKQHVGVQDVGLDHRFMLLRRGSV